MLLARLEQRTELITLEVIAKSKYNFLFTIGVTYREGEERYALSF